jgi:hypothetical protein
MSPSSPTISANGTATGQTKTTQAQSPYLPTPTERFLLAIYPATLVVGSLFSLLDPSARSAPYSSTLQSHPSDQAPSYFAQKRNVFNQFFVKKGWAWVTVSFFLFMFTHPSLGPPRSLVVTPRRLRGVLRWALVTTVWIFVTQWFFGPAIIDRGFILTGGACELVRKEEQGEIDMDRGQRLVTGVACKAVGGEWKGGHDISGHVFILVLGSLFLVQEVLFVIAKSARVKDERTVLTGDGALKSADVEIVEGTGRDGVAAKSGRWGLGVNFVMAVAILSWWMLLMTAAYFHTWFEKVNTHYSNINVAGLTASSSLDYSWHSVRYLVFTFCPALFQPYEVL